MWLSLVRREIWTNSRNTPGGVPRLESLSATMPGLRVFAEAKRSACKRKGPSTSQHRSTAAPQHSVCAGEPSLEFRQIDSCAHRIALAGGIHRLVGEASWRCRASQESPASAIAGVFPFALNRTALVGKILPAVKRAEVMSAALPKGETWKKNQEKQSEKQGEKQSGEWSQDMALAGIPSCIRACMCVRHKKKSKSYLSAGAW